MGLSYLCKCEFLNIVTMVGDQYRFSNKRLATSIDSPQEIFVVADDDRIVYRTTVAEIVGLGFKRALSEDEAAEYTANDSLALGVAVGEMLGNIKRAADNFHNFGKL